LILATALGLVAILDLALGIAVCDIDIYTPLTAPLNSVKHLQVTQPTLEIAKWASMIRFQEGACLFFSSP